MGGAARQQQTGRQGWLAVSTIGFGQWRCQQATSLAHALALPLSLVQSAQPQRELSAT